MVLATTFGGLLMWAVHKVATGSLAESEYSAFGMFLRVLNLMSIPACGLQAVFARQAAVALDEEGRSRLSALVRGAVRLIFIFWAVCTLGVLVFHSQLQEVFKLSGLFLTLSAVIGLLILLRPIGVGILQGKQNFCWVGWSQIFDGAGRLLMVMLILIWLKGQSAGALTGVLFGLILCLGVCMWKTYDVWMRPGCKIDLWYWVKSLAPLTFGAGIPLFMISADALVVQAVFPAEEVNLYAAAGIVTQALVFFTFPITAVMFPKIARSAAQSEETSVLLLALAVTGGMAGCVVAGTFLFPTLPIRIMFAPDYLPAAELIPWFSLAMLPLTMSTVLINNLLARGNYKMVPWLWMAAGAYLVTLIFRHESFIQVIGMIGLFNTLMLGIVLFFSLRQK